MTVYYNEIDPGAAIWLQHNMDAGLIAPGIIDTRSIEDVTANDLKGFTQVHLFAGIGGWSYAAHLAGWPDDRPLWTASFPCQPFSAAGKQLGTDDPRHLWPHGLRLVRTARPAAIVGEQVAGKAGYGWFDGVRAGLAGENYTSRCVDIPALTVDAPHERNRLYWVAVADSQGVERGAGFREGRAVLDGPVAANRDGEPVVDTSGDGRRQGEPELSVLGRGPAVTGTDGAQRPRRKIAPRPLDNPAGVGRGKAIGKPGNDLTAHGQGSDDWTQRAHGVDRNSGSLADPDLSLVQGQPSAGQLLVDEQNARTDYGRNGSFWSGADWIVCHDGKARRVADACAPLLVNGVRGGVPILRPATVRVEGGPLGEEVRYVSRIAAWKGFGNGIVPQLAAEVIASLAIELGYSE